MSRILRPNAPFWSSSSASGVEPLPRSAPRLAAPACPGTARRRSRVSSSSSAGSSSSIRLIDDGVGLFELLLEDVRGLRAEPAGRLVLQDAHPVARLEQHGVRGDLEPPAVQILQRLNHGRHEIGATADRLGEDHVRASPSPAASRRATRGRRTGSRSTPRAPPRRRTPGRGTCWCRPGRGPGRW